MKNIILLTWSLLFIAACSSTTPTTQDQTSNTEKSLPMTETAKTILFFGNSLTAGYGLPESQAFPALIQQKIDSLNLTYTCINRGNSGETTTGGLERLEWVLQEAPAVFVLELGANDGLRGIDLDITKKNLEAIIDHVRAFDKNIKIVLTGMQLPPNMGSAYADKFTAIFPEIAKAKEVYLVPFLLEGVAGHAELNQLDGIHPNENGTKIVANNVWKELKKLL